jgi:hypothetical protein
MAFMVNFQNLAKNCFALLFTIAFTFYFSPTSAQTELTEDATMGVATDIFSEYLLRWHLADDSKYFKITTGIPFENQEVMTSFQIDYWGYEQNWQITVGWYSFGTSPVTFFKPSVDIQGIYDFDHIYLGSENVNGTDYVTFLIPNSAMSQYGNITVNSLTGTTYYYLTTGWENNWSSTTGVDVSLESNTKKLEIQNRISSNDNIGIGTLEPLYPLHIEGGDVAHFSQDTESTLRTGTDIDNNLELNVGEQNAYIDFFENNATSALNHIFYIRNEAKGTSDNNDIRFQTNTTDRLTIKTNGNIGIGTTNPGTYKLAVEGQIGARSVKVTQAAWADYVFAPSYQLMPLNEVEAYITQNQHLPNVPSAKEVEENGFVLEEMDAKLMEKIEELTLYVIEQQKEINALKEELKRNNENHENKK